jgi:hypothetical protein
VVVGLQEKHRDEKEEVKAKLEDEIPDKWKESS